MKAENYQKNSCQRLMDVRQSPFLLEIRDVTRRYTLPRESLFKPPAEVQALSRSTRILAKAIPSMRKRRGCAVLTVLAFAP